MNEPVKTDPESLSAEFDRIYSELLTQDTMSRQIQGRIDTIARRIKRLHHQKNVENAALRHNSLYLRKIAAGKLRELAGVKVLPGFKGEMETVQQFHARLRNMRAKVEAEHDAAMAAKKPA